LPNPRGAHGEPATKTDEPGKGSGTRRATEPGNGLRGKPRNTIRWEPGNALRKALGTATGMSLVIEQAFEVDAPAELLWQVVSDLPAYSEWNPFVVRCRSSLVVGSPITMQVQLLPWFTQKQQETVFEHVPGRTFCYGLDGGAIGAVISRRCHVVRAVGETRAHYSSRFEMSGWLAPVVATLLGSRLEHGFASMAEALRRRAEQLARAR